MTSAHATQSARNGGAQVESHRHREHLELGAIASARLSLREDYQL